ncbi:MAG TPA: SRPBCC family protein [Lautropia sp.]|nr:SRPBCC family protein [Lautropia sp.]
MHRQVRNQHRIRVPASADTAFMFFTPAGEELWVDGWRPMYLQPADGTTREGMIFTTGEGEDFTIWHLVDFNRVARQARYIRCTPALRTGLVEVQCLPLHDASTEVIVNYEMTALTHAGEASLSAYEGQAFVDMIEGWSTAIGESLPLLLETRIR